MRTQLSIVCVFEQNGQIYEKKKNNNNSINVSFFAIAATTLKTRKSVVPIIREGVGSRHKPGTGVGWWLRGHQKTATKLQSNHYDGQF